jgi:hypothetical protein
MQAMMKSMSNDFSGWRMSAGRHAGITKLVAQAG